MSRRSRRSRRPGSRPQFGQGGPPRHADRPPPRGPSPSRMPAPSPSPSGFESLTRSSPSSGLRLETVPSELSMRAMDLITPIRKGPARAHRGPATDGQNRAPPADRQGRPHESPGGGPSSFSWSTSDQRGDRFPGEHRKSAEIVPPAMTILSPSHRGDRAGPREGQAHGTQKQDVLVLLDSLTAHDPRLQQ